MENDETILIDRCRNGDMIAFEELVSKYSGLAGSIAYNIVGDMHIASDLVQETFLKVYKGLNGLENPQRFKGWLCSIVRTTCVDWIRKEKLNPASMSLDKMIDSGLEPKGTKAIGSISKQTPTEVEELHEKILNMINNLPKVYRDVLLLKHLRNFTYKEMSDFLGVPIATIESRLYRARKLLHGKMKDLYM